MFKTTHITITNHNPDPDWWTAPWFAVCATCETLNGTSWWDGYNTVGEAVIGAMTHHNESALTHAHRHTLLLLELVEQPDLLV